MMVYYLNFQKFSVSVKLKRENFLQNLLGNSLVTNSYLFSNLEVAHDTDLVHSIMNKTRRKLIEKIIEQLETLKDEVESITEEEQEAYDNLPDGIQDSEKGETMYEAISDLEDASSNFDDIIDTLQDIIER